MLFNVAKWKSEDMEKLEHYTLFVRMQNGAAGLENSLSSLISSEVKHRVTIWPRESTLSIYIYVYTYIYILRVDSLGHIVTLCLTSEEMRDDRLFSKPAAPFCILTKSV